MQSTPSDCVLEVKRAHAAVSTFQVEARAVFAQSRLVALDDAVRSYGGIAAATALEVVAVLAIRDL